MGFSPGDFASGFYPEKYFHWEAKDNWLVLWDEKETTCILTLTYEQATECLQQLRTCIWSATGEDPI